MQTFLYLVAVAALLGGIALELGDYALEERFPAAGMAMIGVGMIMMVTIYYLGRRKL